MWFYTIRIGSCKKDVEVQNNITQEKGGGKEEKMDVMSQKEYYFDVTLNNHFEYLKLLMLY